MKRYDWDRRSHELMYSFDEDKEFDTDRHMSMCTTCGEVKPHRINRKLEREEGRVISKTVTETCTNCGKKEKELY